MREIAETSLNQFRDADMQGNMCHHKDFSIPSTINTKIRIVS